MRRKIGIGLIVLQVLAYLGGNMGNNTINFVRDFLAGDMVNAVGSFVIFNLLGVAGVFLVVTGRGKIEK